MSVSSVFSPCWAVMLIVFIYVLIYIPLINNYLSSDVNLYVFNKSYLKKRQCRDRHHMKVESPVEIKMRKDNSKITRF